MLSLPAVSVLLEALDKTFDLRPDDRDTAPPLLSNIAALQDADGLMSRSGNCILTAVVRLANWTRGGGFATRFTRFKVECWLCSILALVLMECESI